MKVFSQVLSYSLPAFYAGLVGLYYAMFSGRSKNLFRYSALFMAVVAVLHATEISSRNIALHTMPLSTAHDAFSFLAFSILFVYLLIELAFKNRGSGLFILTFAFVLELISSLTVTWQPEVNPLLARQTFAVHASISIMGYTALSLSAIYALLYLMQNHNMKKRRFGRIYEQLPAISYLEKMSMRSVAIGIILLGLGIFHGHIQASKVLGDFWPHDVKVFVMDAVWLFYVLGYIVARIFKWRGRWMAWLSLSGFHILIIGGGIIIFLSESFHKFY